MKRTLLVFSQRGTNKPVYLFNVTVEPQDNMLGARDIIALAYGDFQDADELRVVREEVALARKWIDKPIPKGPGKDRPDPFRERSGPHVPRAKPQRSSANAVSLFD